MTIRTAAIEMVTSPTAGTDSKMKSLLVVVQHALATVARVRQFHLKANKHLSWKPEVTHGVVTVTLDSQMPCVSLSFLLHSKCLRGGEG